MSDGIEQARKRRKLRQAVYGMLLLLAFVCAGWYLTSDSFREFIRHRVIAQLEDATGGRVEIGSVQWNLSHLQVRLENLTIHGLEAADQAPLLHVSRIDADVRIVSLLGRQVSFNTLEVTDPAVNLLGYEDGSTNQPSPRARMHSGRRNAIEPIFDFAIRSL